MNPVKLCLTITVTLLWPCTPTNSQCVCVMAFLLLHAEMRVFQNPYYVIMVIVEHYANASRARNTFYMCSIMSAFALCYRVSMMLCKYDTTTQIQRINRRRCARSPFLNYHVRRLSWTPISNANNNCTNAGWRAFSDCHNNWRASKTPAWKGPIKETSVRINIIYIVYVAFIIIIIIILA